MAGNGSVLDRLDEEFGWSPRQQQVLDLLARNRTNAQIAETLGISLDGAKWHVREVLSKLGVDSREEAAEYWRAYNGWLRRGRRMARGLLTAGGLRWSLAGIGAVAAGAVVAAVLVVPGGDGMPGVAAEPVGRVSPPPVGNVTVVPPAEEIVMIGKVDRVIDQTTFIGSSSRFSGVSVDVSKADPVYPRDHVPREGDDFNARGRWLGAIGNSTFEVEFVDYNIERWRGVLTPVPGERGVYELYSQRRIRYDPTSNPWRTIVIRATNLTHAAMSPDHDVPLEAFEELPAGTGVDVIGWDDRNGRLVVTYIEASLPSPDEATPTPQATVMAAGDIFVPWDWDGITGLSSGAALVFVRDLLRVETSGSSRRQLTPEEAAQFNSDRPVDSPKPPVQAGQWVGSAGHVTSVYQTWVTWLSGDRPMETIELHVPGGPNGDAVTVVEGLPLPEPGHAYVMFLVEGDDWVAPLPVQFRVEGGVLEPHAHNEAGVGRDWLGSTVAEFTAEARRQFDR